MVALPLFLFLIINWFYETIRSLVSKHEVKELKIPDGMKVEGNIRKEGGKFKGTVNITYTQTIRIINKPHPVEAATEEELQNKYQEIINKYIIK
ncbi:MAG: hypothetical protein KDK36_10475 [Leptospiraceae bacterium]|nr:hypothetical protein [Leptospiraceae bacterium]